MFAVIQILLWAVHLYSIILIVYAFLSWFPGVYDTAVGRVLIYLVEPILKPFYRFRLQFFGLDFTIVLALFVLRFLSYLIGTFGAFLLW